jgi:hypothetical protein
MKNIKKAVAVAPAAIQPQSFYLPQFFNQLLG